MVSYSALNLDTIKCGYERSSFNHSGGVSISAVHPLLLFGPNASGSIKTKFWLFRNPAIGFYVIVFLIPFASFRKIGPINITWVISSAVFFVFAVKFIKKNDCQQYHNPIPGL
jgi:hypothetical protein